MSRHIAQHHTHQGTQTEDTRETVLANLRWSPKPNSTPQNSVELDSREDSNCISTQTDITFDNKLKKVTHENRNYVYPETDRKYRFDNPYSSPPKKPPKNPDESSVLKDFAMTAVKTAAVSGAVLGGVAIAVPMIGFGAGGIAAGSMAAAFQSTFLGGSIAAGSVFATLQSIGAAGLAASTQAVVVAISATAAAIHTAFNKKKT